MGFTEQFDVLLLTRKRGRVVRLFLAALLALLVLDVVGTLLLRLAPSIIIRSKSPPAWSWAQLGDFRDDTLDLFLLLILRTLLVATLGVAAVRCGTPNLTAAPAEVDGLAPLLLNGSGGGSVCEVVPPESGGNGAAQPTHAVKAEHLRSHALKEAAEVRKGLLVAAIFGVSTAAQVYVGVKCISFRGEWERDAHVLTAQGVLFGVAVLLINVESWLLKRLVHALTAEVGFFVPEFHSHPLYFHPSVPNHKCDLCRNKTGQVYRCPLCDWDACPACFNKKDRSTGEGVLRGDKGVKSGGALTTSQYFRRGLKLALPQLPLFGVALLCVVTTSALRLFLPNFQGQIFDHVIAGSQACMPGTPGAHEGKCGAAKASFLQVILLYLGCSVALGALGGLSSLCFNLISRRIIVSVRETLFRQLIKQDIAFFDGMRTGDLTQRLGSDVRAMASPVTVTLSMLISNTLLLVGGVIMCFVTSWQLSMVAYTTVLPIMHVTEAYAKWSGRINRQIYQHYSDAMSAANEAIANVRTVRAFSAEPAEASRVAGHLSTALAKGIRDSCLGALASMFNNYLDLGAGVLILWYGGSIAMGGGSITVGSLIKYQLYWNMINSAWQALNGLLNSFTRAAGAAERVLALVDLEPDIPPAGGKRVSSLRDWTIEISEVAFRYQMRPGNPVLEGVSFSVPAGSVCALVGRSGGGKSTLVHLLLRYYDPLSGAIRLGGADYRDLDLPSLHAATGVVSQDSQLFDSLACTIKHSL